MSLILVVEQEARYVERIHDALSSEGWQVCWLTFWCGTALYLI